ncbi:MAG: hypothetical protein H8E09_00160 [Gammaproteobacteria bacterium]|nr:hypothetical protein [Gammaproteobacteria bacterium]
MDIYEIIFWAYLALALVTLIPTLRNLAVGVKLNPGGASFDQCIHFSEENRQRLKDHYSRLMGTLGFWKKRAETFTSFHYYCAVWTILSAWAVPIIASLSPATTDTSIYSKLLIVLVSGHVALSLSFHKGLKVADGMKAFRHGESEFYDLYRRLLDRPHTLGKDEEVQIDTYFSEVERIRRFVRSAETESLPAIEDARQSANNG